MTKNNDTKRGQSAKSDMKDEIEKLLNEPTKLPELSLNSKQQRSNGGSEGLRVVGGRVRRFTESVTVSSGKHTVIHENGEWKAGENENAENETSGQKSDAAGKMDKNEATKLGGKSATLAKTERMPFGKNSRHSRTGLRGLPKKGGGGGKCVWGKPGSELQAAFDPAAFDAGDPNYDSYDEDMDNTITSEEAKRSAKRLTDEELLSLVDSALKEFFQHANVDDCIDSLGDVPFGRYYPAAASASSKNSNEPGDSNAPSGNGSTQVAGNSQLSPSDSGYAVSVAGARNGASNEEFAHLFGQAPKSRCYLIVREAVLLSFERHSADRELVSQLFAELSFQKRLDAIDFYCGFDTVLRDLPDVRTDCPDAPKWTGMFLARAIDDDVFDGEKFLSTFRGRSRSAAMTMALDKCATLLELRKPRRLSTNSAAPTNGNANNHGRAHESGSKSSLNSAGSGSAGGLWNVWGIGGSARPVNSLVREIRMVIDEYIASDDFSEALRCVTDLDVPHFHHEIVYQAVLAVLETAHSATRCANVATRMCTLLRRFAEAGALPVGELEIGFRRVFSELPDLELDVPHANSAFEQFAALCEHQGYLPRSVLKEMAGSKMGRKRYMSEADASVSRGTDACSLKFAADL